MSTRTSAKIVKGILLGSLLTAAPIHALAASPTIAEADRNFAVDKAPPETRGKIMPGSGKYTDAGGLYTFLMPAGWTMQALDDEPPGIAFRGGKDRVNCVLSAMRYWRGPTTLAELQAIPEQAVRTTYENALIADTGWKKVQKRGKLALDDGSQPGRTPVNAWTWGGLSPKGEAYDTAAIVETPAAALLVFCSSEPKAGDAAERVIRRSFRLAEGALIAPAGNPAAPAAPKTGAEDKSEAGNIYKEAMRAYQRGDYDTALQLLSPLAEQGHAKSQFTVGVMHERGYGVAKDDTKAVTWYRKAAEQGHVNAQYNLGLMLHAGRGVAKDGAESAVWYRKAAEQGHAVAQFNTGLNHANGTGVEKNPSEAANWYGKAAEQGYAKAQTNLGLLYSKGDGVAKDDAEAVKWYRLAAAQGRGSAQFNLGLKLLSGQGAAKDPVAAYMWINLAGQNDEKKAADKLAALEKQLTPEQVEQAKKLADECKARDYRDCR